MQIELLIPLSGIISLIFAVFLSLKVIREKPGNELMKEISNMIEQFNLHIQFYPFYSIYLYFIFFFKSVGVYFLHPYRFSC